MCVLYVGRGSNHVWGNIYNVELALLTIDN